MKARLAVLSLVLCFLAVAVCFGDDLNMGTWKLNEAKSKFSPGSSKGETVIYEAAGDNVKVTVDGIDGMGKPMHTEWTGKFDGKDYPVSGDPIADMRSYKKVNDRAVVINNKKDGKPTTTVRIVVAADGKSRTVTSRGTDPTGKKVSWSAVYDKQ
jgi:hypothetical protein